LVVGRFRSRIKELKNKIVKDCRFEYWGPEKFDRRVSCILSLCREVTMTGEVSGIRGRLAARRTPSGSGFSAARRGVGMRPGAGGEGPPP